MNANRLFICEKPSQAADIAKVLGGARKGESHWETAGGRVTWCYGHMLELLEPEDYDAKFGQPWNFSVLPITAPEYRYVPNRPKDWMSADLKAFTRRSNAQLKAIGELLRSAGEVVIATDPDRQGEMIARNVLAHFRFRDEGRVQRLWLTGQDEASVKKALARMKPASETKALHEVARALAVADWLVGMNGTRGVTLKTQTKGVQSIGRVQTPTLALIVRRDREIAGFKPRDYFELLANITAASGARVGLRHAPKDEDKRIWDRTKAEAVAKRAAGQSVTLAFESTPKNVAPPKLFSLAGLQKEANRRWDWPAKKTLEVAQALYETHKATTYPRTNCEFLPEEQLSDVQAIASNLIGLPEFKHLAGHGFEPRRSVFNTAKVEAHHAIIPTTAAAPLDRMDGDERKLYLMVASRYLASLLPDYEYLASKISTEIEGLEFAATGAVPTKQGWKIIAGADDGEEQGAPLPGIKNGEAGTVAACEVEGKKTKPPAHYTEAALIDDMENVAKYVTDPAKKALLKSTEGKVGSADKGIGTSATRGDIIETIKKRGTVELRGKQLWATPKGHALIELLERDLPALADPGETAVWEERLGLVAEGKIPAEQFMREMEGNVGNLITVLGKRADAGPQGRAVEGDGVVLTDYGTYYTATGVKGRLFKEFFGHKFTDEEMLKLVKGEAITLMDCHTKDGRKLGEKRVRFNAKKTPWPGVEFADEAVAGAKPAARRMLI